MSSVADGDWSRLRNQMKSGSAYLRTHASPSVKEEAKRFGVHHRRYRAPWTPQHIQEISTSLFIRLQTSDIGTVTCFRFQICAELCRRRPGAGSCRPAILVGETECGHASRRRNGGWVRWRSLAAYMWSCSRLCGMNQSFEVEWLKLSDDLVPRNRKLL